MTDETSQPPAVFTPANEPYLGRQSVYHFDQVIVSCLEANARVAAYTHAHAHQLSDLQKAACQIIPQGINLALSIRELVRQGYLFAAVVLMRPLIERAAGYLVPARATRPSEPVAARVAPSRAAQSGHNARHDEW